MCVAETKRTLLERILEQLNELTALIKSGHNGRTFEFRVGPVSDLPTKGHLHMATTLKDNQNVSVTLQAKDKAGQPLPFTPATPPVWGSSDTTIVTVVASADGLSATVTTVGNLGNCQVVVDFTDTDGTPVKGIGDITVTNSGLGSFSLVFGTPTDNTPPVVPPPAA